MSHQYLKGLSWQLGVLLLLLIGRISTSVAGKVSSSETNASSPSDDYGTEEDESSPMGEQKKETELSPIGEQRKESGPIPYFDEKVRTLYVKPENNTKIDCPVKNYTDSNQLSWYKDGDMITLGDHAIKLNKFQVDAKMNLIINEFTNSTLGNYTCRILPQNIEQLTILKLGNGGSMFLPVTITFVFLTSIGLRV